MLRFCYIPTLSSSSDVGLFVVSFVRHWSVKLINLEVLKTKELVSPTVVWLQSRKEDCTISLSASVSGEGFWG